MIKAPEKKIRVLVVDDSAFMCKVLKEIINSDRATGSGRTRRATAARRGACGIAAPRCHHHGHQHAALDGLQATELIMSQHPAARRDRQFRIPRRRRQHFARPGIGRD